MNYPGLDARVYFESDRVHEVLVDDRYVESSTRVGFEVVMPLATDARGVLEGNEISVGIGAHRVILQIPEKFGEDVHVLVRPGRLLGMMEEGVFGLEELAECEVVVGAGILGGFDRGDRADGEEVIGGGEAECIVSLGSVVASGFRATVG